MAENATFHFLIHIWKTEQDSYCVHASTSEGKIFPGSEGVCMRYMYGWVFICLLMYDCVQCTCVCMYVKVRGQPWGHFSDSLHLVLDMGGSLVWHSQIWLGWMACDPQGYAHICLPSTEMTRSTCEQSSLTVSRGYWELSSDPSHKLSTPLAEPSYFPFTTSQLGKLQLREWLSHSHPMAASGNRTWHPTVAMNPVPLSLSSTWYSLFLLYFKRYSFLHHCCCCCFVAVEIAGHSFPPEMFTDVMCMLLTFPWDIIEPWCFQGARSTLCFKWDLSDRVLLLLAWAWLPLIRKSLHSDIDTVALICLGLSIHSWGSLGSLRPLKAPSCSFHAPVFRDCPLILSTFVSSFLIMAPVLKRQVQLHLRWHDWRVSLRRSSVRMSEAGRVTITW